MKKDKNQFHEKFFWFVKKTKLLKNPEQKTETFNVPENQCQLIKLFPVKKKIERHWSKLRHSITIYNLGTRYPITTPWWCLYYIY